MRTILLAQAKGGAAKSTAALVLAGALHERGFRAVLVDADPQGTLSALRASSPLRILDAVPHASAPDPLAAALAELEEAPELLVVDTPGLGPRVGADRALRAALARAELVLIPCQASPADLRATDALRPLLEEAAAAGFRPLVRALCSRVRPGSLLGAELPTALRLRGLEPLRAALGDRTAFARALIAGDLPRAFGDPRATAEAHALAIEVLGLLELPPRGKLDSPISR